MRLFSKRIAGAIILMLSPVAPTVLGQTASSASDEQKTVMEVERQMSDADAHHNADQMSKLLDDAYLVKSMDGKVFDKSATLESVRLDANAERKSGKSQPAPMLEGLRATVLDGSALAVFNFTIDMGDKTLHCQMTDTLLKRTEGWKLVGRTAVCR